MDTRYLPYRDYQGLKASFRTLVDMCGGYAEAAKITRVSAQMLHAYGDPNKMDCFPPIDVIADLEAHADNSPSTAKQADLRNMDLVPRSGPEKLEPQHIGHHLGDVSGAMSDTIRSMGIAMADGKLTAAEMMEIRRFSSSAHAQLSELDRDLDLALQGKPDGMKVVGGEGI